MNVIKKPFIKTLIDASLHQLGELSVKIAEYSTESCCFAGAMYETKFPEELLRLEEE
ncbi:AgrD family cyclic lactone autoinducer peptide [Clostridium taeniosporum]|uniref:AgrD family cyclic lactone autoinducer peptide n=1 Tax=Clostridium taeniosporum TaxID=394958 RepID=UPI000F7395D2|nr:cyclic lactone autoinducer peptide [Clostridium taeniosporum]